jgi:hypothetical protein
MKERISFKREMGLLVPPADVLPLAREVPERLCRRITNLSLLPYRAEHVAKKRCAHPGACGSENLRGSTSYRIAKVMKQPELAHISVASADFTNKASARDFAGAKHKQRLFAARVPKIAVVLAAFQLRHDLQIAAATGKFAKIDDLFGNVRSGRLA